MRARSALPPVERIAPAETHRAAELRDQVLAVALGQLASRGVVHHRRLVDVLLHLGEASPVGLAGTVVQYGQARGRQSAVVDDMRRRRARAERPVLHGDEIEDVELAARLGEQPLDVAQTLEVVHDHGTTAQAHDPGVALAAEDGLSRDARWRSLRHDWPLNGWP